MAPTPIAIRDNGCTCQTDYICQMHYRAAKGDSYDPVKDAQENRPRPHERRWHIGPTRRKELENE